MLPARTTSPPNAFTPRYFGPESRPLREEPTPFLCAMRATSAELHVGDADFGERLPVAGVAAVTGAAGEAVDPDLGALAVPHHFDRHLRALHDRLPRVHLLAVAREQHAVEGHFAPRLGLELGELERDPGLGPELAAADRENGVGHGGRNSNRNLELRQIGRAHV